MSKFYKLTVESIVQETEKAVAIGFKIPEELKETFVYIPGQYITIEKELNGEKIRRAYSICESVQNANLKIGVKRVEGGSFSVFATTDLKVGDVLDVSPPEGRFILDLDSDHSNNYLAFAAGSGITPVLSMISSALAIEEESKFVLVYGNKTKDEVMFKEALNELVLNYPERFAITYVFSQYKVEDSLFGRIDQSTLNYILKNKYKDTQFDSVFLCGPEPMINTLSKGLISENFKEDQVLFELFTTSKEDDTSSETFDGDCVVTMILDDEEHQFAMDTSKTILEQALVIGLDAPYSCQGGICSTCIAQVSEGSAKMEKNSILTDDEVASGLVLTCQAHPVSQKITIDYDDV